MQSTSRRSLFPSMPFPLGEHLILVPHFHDQKLLALFRRYAVDRRRRLGGEWLYLESFTLITGFLGYPALFTHLAYITEPLPQRISLLGTAGALTPAFDSTRLVQVNRIMGSGALRGFSRQPLLEMGGPLIKGLQAVTGVSVDLVQRETPAWLRRQRVRGAQIVEMELFPLRARLKRDITALVILTDRVTEAGIQPFMDHDGLCREFRRGLLALARGRLPGMAGSGRKNDR
ncbi:MAG: hypothetical protein JXA62_06405 [Candidatus Aminicenantes bacterium]|nr:hypothetical protein [Candidatus Aminicenantes bacterium]